MVSEDQSTSLEGIWAAGDCTNSSNKFSQVVTAASEGAIAANSIFAFIKKNGLIPTLVYMVYPLF